MGAPNSSTAVSSCSCLFLSGNLVSWSVSSCGRPFNRLGGPGLSCPSSPSPSPASLPPFSLFPHLCLSLPAFRLLTFIPSRSTRVVVPYRPPTYFHSLLPPSLPLNFFLTSQFGQASRHISPGDEFEEKTDGRQTFEALVVELALIHQ